MADAESNEHFAGTVPRFSGQGIASCENRVKTVRGRSSGLADGYALVQKATVNPANEADAETLIEEHLRSRGWDIADFTSTRKRFRDHLDNDEADRVFLHEGKVSAILEAKKPGRDLWAALEQAKGYARAYKRNTGYEVPLLFASDGAIFLRQNIKANTLPERISRFPTPGEFKELFRPQADVLLGNLRDYQRVAVSQVLAAAQAGRTRMYIQMATGTGKTITAAGIIAKLWSLGLIHRALFLVDRDALAGQTERAFIDQLGDALAVRRATGGPDDRFADVLVTTVQHLAASQKYERFPSDHFQLVFLDECHRSYYGDWHGVLEHFAAGGAIRLGLTATPSDKETQNTDRYFCDKGQYQGPIYRYSIRQGEQDGILAQCHHFKFHTNVDLYGVHDMGFDFEPEQLGRAVDVPQRNALIAEKYFEVIGRRDPVKTIVFAASIRHAVNLRYALIRRYNELHHLPPTDATAEAFVVAIHNELKDARERIEEFQRIGGDIRIAIGVGMLDTGIDAPDVEAILMARPTKSKILYVQMKGRGTRKCRETGKDFYKLVDFVDIARLEAGDELVTNETPGVIDEPIDQEDAIVDRARGTESNERSQLTIGEEEPESPQVQEMLILDIPVTLESSEVLAPAMLEDLRRQIEGQLRKAMSRDGSKERFTQTVFSWRYFKGSAPVDQAFIATMGFDVHTLRDLYGEPEASIEDFVAVVVGEADFELLRRRRAFERWSLDKDLNREQRELVQLLCDFRHANPGLTPEQLLRSQWLDGQGGVPRIRALFGSLKTLLAIADDAMAILNPLEEDIANAKDS
ncbi:MAG: DEAD/DEAH box helicase family protein [Acidobacteriota bacterium]